MVPDEGSGNREGAPGPTLDKGGSGSTNTEEKPQLGSRLARRTNPKVLAARRAQTPPAARRAQTHQQSAHSRTDPPAAL